MLDKLEAVPVDPATDRPTKTLRITHVDIFDDPFDKYKERLAKRLQREKDDLDTAGQRRKVREAREKDRLTWFGTKLDEKGADVQGLGQEAVGGVGRYLAAATAPGKRKEADETGAVDLAAKRKRKGFGNLDAW